MSPIGRIFSVLNLILAALFLSWAAMTAADGESYKQDYDQAVADHKVSLEQKDEEIRSLTAEKNVAQNDRDSFRNDKENLEGEVSRLGQDIESLTDKNNELRAAVDRISNSMDSLVSSNETLTSAKDAAIEARHSAETAKDEALRAQQAAESRVADLNAQISSLQKEVGMKEGEIADLNKVISQRDTELAMLVDKTGVSVSDIVAQPLIQGSVIEALYDIEPGLVAINKGSADGVKRGYTFDIYNGSLYKGRVRVENVRENTCTALVTIAVDSQTMGQGDSAATSL